MSPTPTGEGAYAPQNELNRSGSAHGMDFLLTWNCRLIHNSIIEGRLRGICASMGMSLPALCTPPELMADYLQS